MPTAYDVEACFGETKLVWGIRPVRLKLSIAFCVDLKIPRARILTVRFGPTSIVNVPHDGKWVRVHRVKSFPNRFSKSGRCHVFGSVRVS